MYIAKATKAMHCMRDPLLISPALASTVDGKVVEMLADTVDGALVGEVVEILVGEVAETLAGTDCEEVCGGCVCEVLKTLREKRESENRQNQMQRRMREHNRKRDDNKGSEKACIQSEK